MTASENEPSSSTETSESDPASDPIRVCVVDDHPHLREAVADAIETAADMEVCGEAGNVSDGFREIETSSPCVAVIDLSLEDNYGLTLIENVRAEVRDVGSLAFSVYDERVYARRALEAGASGYLMKTEPTRRLIDAIRSVHRGEIVLSDETALRLFQDVAERASSKDQLPFSELSGEEKEVARLLSQGKRPEKVQDRLGLSSQVLETHRRRAKETLGLEQISGLLQHAFS